MLATVVVVSCPGSSVSRSTLTAIRNVAAASADPPARKLQAITGVTARLATRAHRARIPLDSLLQVQGSDAGVTDPGSRVCPMILDLASAPPSGPPRPGQAGERSRDQREAKRRDPEIDRRPA